MAVEEQDEAWAQEDMRAMRRALMTLIHRYYLEAIWRLPDADLQATPARGLLVAGRCYGALYLVLNILLNSIWYAAAAFPLRVTDWLDDADVVSGDVLISLYHRYLDGLKHNRSPKLTDPLSGSDGKPEKQDS